MTALKSGGGDGQDVGMKKSKSLEDLQHELSSPPGLREGQANAVTPARPSTASTVRTCGGNESFRAAVDRSYESPDSAPMEAGNVLCVKNLT